MKIVLYSLLFTLVSVATNAQGFFDRIRISQSMETSDKRDEPAQFQVTIPQKDTASCLLDIGTSVDLNKSDKLLVKAISEYHLNTLTDSKQNNFQVGGNLIWDINDPKDLNKKIDLFSSSDLKYVYDGISINNSVASDILFSIYKDAGMEGQSSAPDQEDTESSDQPVKQKFHLHWNSENFFCNNHLGLFLSPYAGIQLQDIFASKTIAQEGFIFRPLYNLNASVAYNKTKGGPPFKQIMEISFTYTGRYDVVNSTSDPEGYTQLFKAELKYFLLNNGKGKHPLKPSLGVSFNSGSDPLQGLKKQQYYLFTLNISK